VVFVGLDDGEVRGSWRFDITPACPMVREDRAGCGAAAPVEYRGLQWVGDDRVDLVVQDPDPNPDPELVDLGRLVPERLRTIEVEVPSGG
jgi:hypothetical protein